MNRNKLIGIVLIITLAVVGWIVYGNTMKRALSLPDLVVMQATPDFNDGVTVRVKNQGDSAAASCYLALTITLYDNKTTKVFSLQVPALGPRQETEVFVKTELKYLPGANFEAKVDRSNTTKESDETNNSLQGTFGNFIP
jgi:hypothetical protein